MDTERKIYGLLETVEQQQKSLEIAAQALDGTCQALHLLMDEVREGADAGARAGAAQTLGEAGRLIAEAAKPTIAQLQQVTARAEDLESMFRRAALWVTWRQGALVAGGCLTLLLAVWITTASQRAELAELQGQKAALEGQITALKAGVDDLAAKGGKIKLSTCGVSDRKCVKVN